MTTNEIIRRSEQLVEASRAWRLALCESYGYPLPDEAPTPSFQSARRDTEARTGSRLVKFFTNVQEGITAMQQPATNILITTERRLLEVPEPLLAQLQACEKAYAGGRWYIVTPVALWVSLTRLLGSGCAR